MGKNPECVAFFVKHARDENPFARPKKKQVTVKVPPKFLQQLTGAKIEITPADPDAPLTRKEAAKLRRAFNAQVRLAYEAN
jgi:hypothetical protein